LASTGAIDSKDFGNTCAYPLGFAGEQRVNAVVD
jgi:hypothetical protein